MTQAAKILIGEWTVDPSLNCVGRDGRDVKIEPRAMDVLVYLANRPGTVVSSEELLDAVWNGRVVGDGALYRCINQLRDALSDSRDESRFIETIPKRGYRLIAPVRALDAEVAPLPAGKARALRPAPIVALTLAFVVSLSAVYYMSSTPDQHSIAVLPLRDLNATAENPDSFVEGFHADLISQLASIRSLRVLAPAARSGDGDPGRIGRELGVEVVLVGTLERDGGRAHMNLQLVDAATDAYLWSRRYDPEFTAENLFITRAAIAAAVADATQARLSDDEQAQLAAVPTHSTAAANFYWSAGQYFRSPGSDDVPLAVEQYQNAVEADRSFAQAWAGLARSHLLMWWYGKDRTSERLNAAWQAVETARRLAPDAPDTRLALGQYHYQAERDYARALEEYAVAARNGPVTLEILQMQAFIQRRVGDWDEALVNLGNAIALDPRDLDLLSQQSGNYTILRRYAEAEAYNQRVLDIAPDNDDAYLYRAVLGLYRGDPIADVRQILADPRVFRANDGRYFSWLAAISARDYDAALELLDEWDGDLYESGLSYAPKSSFRAVTLQLAGQHDAARPEFERARALLTTRLEVNGDDFRAKISLGETLAGLGDYEEATRLAWEAIGDYPPQGDRYSAHVFQTEIVLRILVPAGEHSAAIGVLEDYFAVPGRWSIDGLRHDPRLDPIRDHPRFQALVSAYGTAQAGGSH